MNTRTLKTAKIKITTKCNRDCGFCIFANGARGENMSLELFSTILDKLGAIPFQQLHINGGEPTVHRDFPALSRLARTRLPETVMVLGTNGITLARNQRLMANAVECYDQILIGCDDEHGNYEQVETVVPVLRQAGKTVVINSVLEAIGEPRRTRLAHLCDRYGAIHVTNHVHHIDVGQPINRLGGLCARYLDQHLMIELDGSCYRCFNAMAKEDSEFNVRDPDFAAKVFAPRSEHYRFCLRCHEYTDSGASVVPSGRVIPTCPPSSA